MLECLQMNPNLAVYSFPGNASIYISTTRQMGAAETDRQTEKTQTVPKAQLWQAVHPDVCLANSLLGAFGILEFFQ